MNKSQAIMLKTFFRPILMPICLLLISNQLILGANIKIENLKSELKIIHDDSLKFNMLDQISWQYLQINLDSAEKYNTIFNEQAIKTNNEKYQSIGFNTTGVIQWYRGNMEKTLMYIKKALFLNLQRKDTLLLASNYGNIGLLYDNLGQSDSAIKYYQKSIKYAGLTNNFTAVAKSHINLALLFTDVKNYKLALKHNFKAEKTYLEIKNFTDLPILYNNIGSIYKINKLSDSAYFYYSRGLYLADSLELIFSQAKLLQSLGNLYVQKVQYTDALKHFEESLKLSTDLGNIYLITDNYLCLGELYYKQNKSDNAIKYFKLSLENGIKLNNSHTKQTSLQMLSEIYKQKGDYFEAINYLKQHITIKDSLTNENFREKLAEFEVKHETEKKEKELLEQKINVQEKENTIHIITITLIIIFISSIVILRLYILKKNALKKLIEKNIEVSSQRKHIRLKPNEKEKLLFKRLNDYLQNEKAYLNHNLTIEELAKILKTNRTELSNVINKIAKKQFNSFINELRVNEAINYIVDHNYKNPLIEELAKNAGFKSPSVFYKCFKEITGVTPLYFIKNKNLKNAK